MIDIHFHCLPGIDDGPAEWQNAVELCRAAATEGTTHVVATPHVLRERWVNDDPSHRDELLLKLNDLLGGKPAVLPGCEFYFASDALELWEMGAAGPLYGLNRSNYLLVEFPSTSVPPNAEDVIHEFSLVGVTPVIAHPERNLELARSPETLQSLVRAGAVTQVTASSLIGDFGRNVERTCALYHEHGLIHFVASDAHSLEKRPPRLAAAYAWATRKWGSERADAVFVHNPEALVANRPLPYR